MKLNLSSKVRASIYVLFTVAAPVVAYLTAVDVIGENEVVLFTALSTAVFALAGLNTDTSEEV